MNPILKTIARDIIVLSAQAVAFRLAAPQDQQQDVVFAAVPTKGMPQPKTITDENAVKAQRFGF
jgi:phospholipid N-methyltransferase